MAAEGRVCPCTQDLRAGRSRGWEGRASTTQQGPGEGVSLRRSVTVTEGDDLKPDTESAHAFLLPLPQLPIIFG